MFFDFETRWHRLERYAQYDSIEQSTLVKCASDRSQHWRISISSTADKRKTMWPQVAMSSDREWKRSFAWLFPWVSCEHWRNRPTSIYIYIYISINECVHAKQKERAEEEKKQIDNDNRERPLRNCWNKLIWRFSRSLLAAQLWEKRREKKRRLITPFPFRYESIIHIRTFNIWGQHREGGTNLRDIFSSVSLALMHLTSPIRFSRSVIVVVVVTATILIMTGEWGWNMERKRHSSSLQKVSKLRRRRKGALQNRRQKDYVTSVLWRRIKRRKTENGLLIPLLQWSIPIVNDSESESDRERGTTVVFSALIYRHRYVDTHTHIFPATWILN